MKNKQVPDQLPFSRRKQLSFLILDNPSLLFFVNFTAFFFLVPLGFVLSWLAISFNSIIAASEIEGLTAFYRIFYPALTLIPSLIVAGIGFNGVYGVIHELVTKDISKYTHFFSSIKSSWKQFVWYYAILGILVSLVVINFAGYLYLDIGPFFKYFTLVISIVLTIIFIFIKPYVLFQICMFNNNLPQIIRNSIGFVGKRFLFSLLMFLISNVFFILVVVLPGQLRVFAIVVIGLFWIMFSCLTNYLICIDTLEKKLSRDLTNDFYHKGLEE